MAGHLAGRRHTGAGGRTAAAWAVARKALHGLRLSPFAARRLVAWAIAYVLVLQAVLTGFALGAMPAGMDPTLCLSAAQAGAAYPDGGHDNPPPQHRHCEACLARADLPALAPPAPLLVLAPLTGALRLDFGPPAAPLPTPVLSAFRARAPPATA